MVAGPPLIRNVTPIASAASCLVAPALTAPARVRGDAAVALLDDADGEGDELLGLRVQRAGGEGRVVQLAKPL